MIEQVSLSDQIVWAGDVDRKRAMEEREQVLADDCDQIAIPVNAVRRAKGEQVLLDIGQFMALHVLKGKLIPQTEHFAVDIEAIVPGFVADDEIVSETKDLLLHQVSSHVDYSFHNPEFRSKVEIMGTGSLAEPVPIISTFCSTH